MAAPDGLTDRAEEWPVVASRQVYRSPWVVGVRADTLHRPGDPHDTFERLVLEDPGAVVVLPVDDHDQVVVVRQYRHAARRRLVELPAGKLDVVGEEPIAAARRELAEEVGLVADEWRHLLTVYASPGLSEEKQIIYLARGLRDTSETTVLAHEEADMEVDRVPLDGLVEAILAGRIADGPLVSAVLAYEALRARGDV